MASTQIYAASVLAAAVGLSGCASYHVIPPARYSALGSSDPPPIRIAFDQEGSIYPSDPNELGLPMPPQAESGKNAFQLKDFYEKTGRRYDVAQLTSEASDRINNALAAAPGSRLVVLIHGYNNDYADPDVQYEAFRATVTAADPNARHVYLQVYWDGFFRGRGTAPAPLSYFSKSLTYSNRAGMCGLRPIMANLRQGTNVTFVTHSRGAAVAFSTVTDPLWDRGIDRCPPPARAEALRGGDVALVAYAPAVGDEHMRDEKLEPVQAHYDYLDRIYLGFNPNDPATGKKYFGIKAGARRWGDTRLGSKLGYVDLIAGASRGRLQYATFEQPYHGWDMYLADQDRSRCLLWAGGLIQSKPSKCELSR